MQFIAEIKNSIYEIRAGALLIVNSYIEDLIYVIDLTKYLLDSDSKDENDNFSSFGAAVLLKFDTLQSLETYPVTLYFQV